MLLCCPVLCRNAFKVALRSSLIFSCKDEIQRRISCWGLQTGHSLKQHYGQREFCYCQALAFQQNPKHCNILGEKNQFIYPGKIKSHPVIFLTSNPRLWPLAQVAFPAEHYFSWEVQCDTSRRISHSKGFTHTFKVTFWRAL